MLSPVDAPVIRTVWRETGPEGRESLPGARRLRDSQEADGPGGIAKGSALDDGSLACGRPSSRPRPALAMPPGLAISVCSTMTTQSAPAGTIAPVITFAHWRTPIRCVGTD